MAGRLIAIGDIHGCAQALHALVQDISPQPGDQIVTLGDYIDRGPDSRGAINQLIELSRKTTLIPLMGNHDKMLLSILAGNRETMVNWLAMGGHRTLQSFGCRGPEQIPQPYIDFLLHCGRSFETPSHVFLHANYLPALSLDEQPTYVLRWESLKARCPPPHYSGKIFIVGHTPQKSGNVLDLGYLKCIDTYCCSGGWLTALDVVSGHIWQANQAGAVRHRDLRPSGPDEQRTQPSVDSSV